MFTPASFTGYGSRAAIDKALQRLVAQGALRRLSRGLYDKPAKDPLIGDLWPSVDAVVRAIAGKDKIRTLPAGAYAANLLGLSEQVPAQIVLLTDGTSRTVRAGPVTLTFKSTTPRNMAAARRLSGRVIQAFKYLGPRGITQQHVNHLRKTLPAAERLKLLADLELAPGWMRPMLQAVAKDDRAGKAKR